MTRIVRFEELNGELILRVPEDVARRLNLSAEEELVMKDADRTLTIEPLDEEAQNQWRIAIRVLEENDEVLAALAR